MRQLLTVFVLFLTVFTFTTQVNGAEQQTSIQVDSVQADFTQEKQLPILSRPIVSKGKFVFQAPDSLRWEYYSPIHSVLLMHDGRTRKFIKHDGEFVEESGMGVDSMQIVLQEITGWLDGKIGDTPTFKVQSTNDDLIVLTPKDESLAKIISRIELKLLGTSGLMESVTLFEGAESFTRMVFSNSILNENILIDHFTTP